VKIAVDTNVLVRFLTWDDPEQAAQAAQVIEEAEMVFISTVVLCELVWVLRRAYRYKATEIVATLQTLIESRTVETDRAAAESGLQLLAAGGDFADGVILYEAERAKAAKLATFDQGFASRARTDTVMFLPVSPIRQ